MVREVGLGLESLLAAVRYGLGQYLVIQRIREQNMVLPQVVVHVLRHVEADDVTLLRLNVVVDNLLAVAHNLADEEGLDCAFSRYEVRGTRCEITFFRRISLRAILVPRTSYLVPRIIRLVTRSSFLLSREPLPDEVIHRRQQRLLFQS